MLEGWDAENWRSLGFLPLHLRLWGWLIIAVFPLLIAFFRLRQSLIPVLTMLAASLLLPACRYLKTENYTGPYAHPYTHSEPNIFAHIVVTAMAIFLGWWGVRQNSKSLVNYGIVGFAISVGWFYFTDLFDKLGRSLGLIGLGVLFLAGGWALERTRRRLISHIAGATAGEAQ